MEKYGDSKPSRSRWKDDNRNPKLYDERTDKPGSVKIANKSSGRNKTEIAKINLPDDVRISSLLRRLETEKTIAGLIDICDKLKNVVQDSTNANYIRRSFDLLSNSVIKVMQDCPQEALPHLCDVFGLMGYAVHYDFPIYKSWICKTYKSTKSLRPAMMKSLEKTLKMDETDAELDEQISRLMELLRDFLERADDAATFTAITKVLMVISNNYPSHFKPHFSNIVDIIVGWHLELDQNSDVKLHCSVVLQSFQCWKSDSKFTLDLLRQLLEDIEACNDEDGGDMDESKLKEFGSFVGVLNTIIKCVSTDPQVLVSYTTKEFLDDSYAKIMRAAKSTLQKSCEEEIVLSMNEFLLIILECRRVGVDIEMADVQEIVEIELENLETLGEASLASFFTLMIKFIEEYKATLTVELINKLFDFKSPLVKTIRFYSDYRVKNGLIRTYQEILALKNVPILQAAYSKIIQDLGNCLREIPELSTIKWLTAAAEDQPAPENTKKSIQLAQFSLIFNLTVLSRLVTTQNSIIAMYSLTPSILETLINLQVWRPEWNEYELVQFSVLKMISAHCLKNNNFVASSSLFVAKDAPVQTSSWLSASPTESPVSQHFKLILEFLESMLKVTPRLNQMDLILDWLDKIIQQTSQFAEILVDNANFVFVIRRINNLAIKFNDEILVKVATCNDSLYAFENLHQDVFTSITELCSIQLCSVNPDIRQRFSFILSRMPLQFTLEQAKAPSGINREVISKTSELESWHLSLGSLHGGELRAQYFQEFINQITFSTTADSIDPFILRAFKNCWYNGDSAGETYKKVTLKDVRTLTSWMQWEAARFCVNNKLRTPLGGPQATFVKIENIIKEHARVLALKDKSKMQNYKHVLANQRNVRILLGFMEALEKAIFNASQGCAFGIPAPEKPARTFFRINVATCNEWFFRNRLALMQLGLHCMELEMVIRCSTSVLRDMVKAGKTNEPYFEKILMSLVWAYLRNFESDALFGLYIWTKAVTGKKLLWIKMAAEQACGHREIAAEGYTKILKDEQLDPQIYDFVNDQRKISTLFAGDFLTLYTIVSEEEMSYFKPQNIPILTINAQQLASYVKYDKTKDPAVLCDLTDWQTLERGDNVSSNFSVHKLISLTENTLSNSMLGMENCSDEQQQSSYLVLHTLLQECIRTGSQEYLNYLTLLNHLSHKAMEHKDLNGFKNIGSFGIKKTFGSLTMFLVTAWSEFFDDYSYEGETQNISLRLDLVSCARKELNYRQCKRELVRLYKKVEYVDHVGFPLEKESLEVIKDFLMSPQSVENPKVWTENVARTVYEHCKILYIGQHQRNDAIQFASTAAFGVNRRLLTLYYDSDDKMRRQCHNVVKLYMKISEWVQSEDDDLLSDHLGMTPLKVLIHSVKDEDHSLRETELNSFMPAIDLAVGKLLQSGTKKCPEMTKVWSAFGSWCYRWGRKMVESKTDSHGLKPVDSQAIVELLPEAHSADIERILNILNEQHIVAEDEDIGPNESSSTEMLESQLRLIPVLKNSDSELIFSIIELWKQAHREVYRYYEMCASAYFNFLLLSSSKEESGDSSVITATLRLLRLIVKHALGLQEVLEEGLSKTPSDPWKVIIPQLFSRLNHFEPYVRRRVSELLCRVAIDSPHLIIFPAVVGAQETSDVAKITDEVEEKNVELEWKNSSLQFCFSSLLETLSMQSPKTVKQSQLLVRELRRIALLWDELWLLSLSQVYAENVKKFQAFDVDFQKTNQSPEKIILFTEKYHLLMRPVLFVFERLHDWTSKPPETNHEKKFQEKFSKHIEDTLEELKKPFVPSDTLAAFNKFKSLYQQIQVSLTKRISLVLKMSDISPVLANLKDTLISMPGVQSANESEAVYIQSVDNIIHILPTKTKPKKLAFYGSDGKRYAFLFKGMEDLHLDERIMQFLSISNLMMKNSVDSDGKVTHYSAHHYSVIPLGPRSGLISWVDGVTPIFSIYRRWQQREAANPRKDQQFIAMRPSELYYSKITPLLKEHGLKPTDNRKDWPLAVQRKAFEELKAETPNSLLASEFWCMASTAAHWRQIVRNYSVSLAVMSVIGYCIGLGDRHLDNILVNLATGDVVHIDYNVCFEKGKTLRVPEKVPFRMTQNIEEALGLTGIEGTFRLSAEHVLKSLKRGRETLLTLLEAFVYDPLVDWAVSEDTATGGLANLGTGTEKGSSNASTELTAARKQLEREVTRDTLAIRFTEIKTDWLQNRDDVHNQLLLMKKHLFELSSNREEIKRLECQRSLLSKQISLVRELDALGHAMSSHPLNTLSQRYNVYKKKRNDVLLIQNILVEKAVESERMLKDYLSFVEDARSKKVNNFLMDMESIYQPTTSISEFDLLKEFLESSNQGQTFIQSAQCRKEIGDLLCQLHAIASAGFLALSNYYEVMKFYPHDHALNHRFAKYSQWCRSLVANKSEEVMRGVAIAYNTSLGEDAVIKEQTPENVVAFEVHLGNFVADVCRRQARCENEIRKFGANMVPAAARKDFRSLLQDQQSAFAEVELTKLATRYLAVETSMSGLPSEHLAKLIINDRWFFHEIKIQAAFVASVNDMILDAQDKSLMLKNSVDCFVAVSECFQTFDRIQLDFQLTIIPQTLRGIITEDKSVLDMITAVSNLQNELPLADLYARLQEDLHNCIYNPNQNGMMRAADLTEAYANMVVDYEGSSTPSEGKDIFLTLNTYFVEMCKVSKAVLSFDKALQAIPNEWTHVSELLQAQSLFISPVKSTVSMALEQVFFVKRIQTMIEFFSYCVQIAWAFKGSGLSKVFNFDAEFLSQPLKTFMSECIAKCILGRGSYCLSLIVCNLVQQRKGDFAAGSCYTLSQLSDIVPSKQNAMEKLLVTFEEEFRRDEALAYLQNEFHKLDSQRLLFSNIWSAHNWLNEEIVIQPNVFPLIPSHAGLLRRHSVVAHMTTIVQKLTNCVPKLEGLVLNLNHLTLTVLQRLKWAAGANPQVSELLASFEAISKTKSDELENYRRLTAIAMQHCNAVTNYEVMRFKTPEAFGSDSEILNFLHQWENVCKAERSVAHTINPIEEALVELLDPEGAIDQAWIKNVTSLIDDMINQVHSDIDANEKSVMSTRDSLDLCAHNLRGFIAAHHRISADIRNLLKSILKHDDSDHVRLKEYLAKYKYFIETITELHGNVLSKDFTDIMVEHTIEQADNSLRTISEIYNDLFTFEKTLSSSLVGGHPKKNLRNQVENLSEYPGSPSRKVYNQKEQKRNALAVSVWRRIRMKLEGRDPDPNKTSRVQEQVDWMIREALNQDNLALLYEGFTSWV